MSQIERRFIVTRLREGFPNWSKDRYEIINQGYWDSREHDILRIRKIVRPGGDSEGEVMRKTGHGVLRTNDRLDISPETAEWWLRTCPYRVEKLRWHFGAWRLDIFQGLLHGLVIAEVTLPDPRAHAELPEWIEEATEVTDRLNNLHIAKMTSVLSARSCPEDYIDYLAKEVPRIVLTGGPCSGKTTVMEALLASLGGRLHFVPEAATIIISQVGVHPPSDDVGLNLFQQQLYGIQDGFEELARLEALAAGKQAVIHDRGKIDNAAYLEGGIMTLQRICRTDFSVEISRVGLVIQLDVPPRDVYEANRGNNAARSESFAQASELDRAITSAYSRHPGFIRISGCASMDEKIARASRAVTDFLETIGK